MRAHNLTHFLLCMAVSQLLMVQADDWTFMLLGLFWFAFGVLIWLKPVKE